MCVCVCVCVCVRVRICCLLYDYIMFINVAVLARRTCQIASYFLLVNLPIKMFLFFVFVFNHYAVCECVVYVV